MKRLKDYIVHVSLVLQNTIRAHFVFTIFPSYNLINAVLMFSLATSTHYPLSTIFLSYILLKTSETFTTLIVTVFFRRQSFIICFRSTVPVLMTFGGVICSLLLTLPAPSKETAIGLGVRFPISFSCLGVMASSQLKWNLLF